MNPYPAGQCTWGAAQMCPCLQDRSKYGNFGNGGDWYAHAQSIGLSASPVAKTGWLASFNVSGWPDGPGDVGLIVSVNPDGTVTRYGTNWHLDGTWSTDKVPISYVIGSFEPPCDCIGPNGTVYHKGQTQSATNCVTFKWSGSFAGQNYDICWDGIVGMAATGGGFLLMAAGLVVMILAAGSGRQRIMTAPQPQQEPVPTPQQVQELSQSDRDAVIMRARQRAAMRQEQYRRTRGYQERRIARMRTSTETAPPRGRPPRSRPVKTAPAAAPSTPTGRIPVVE